MQREPAVSKHARGRTRKLSKDKRARLLNMRRRAVQAQKSATIDASKWHMMLPG